MEDGSMITHAVEYSYGKINHSYQIQVRALKFDKTNSLQFYSAVSKWSINV